MLMVGVLVQDCARCAKARDLVSASRSVAGEVQGVRGGAESAEPGTHHHPGGPRPSQVHSVEGSRMFRCELSRSVFRLTKTRLHECLWLGYR